MSDALIAIIILVCVMWLITGLLYAATSIGCANKGEKHLYNTPKYIYHNSKLNKFGTFCVFMCHFIFSPLYYVGLLFTLLVLSIHDFIYWLGHVGRK